MAHPARMAILEYLGDGNEATATECAQVVRPVAERDQLPPARAGQGRADRGGAEPGRRPGAGLARGPGSPWRSTPGRTAPRLTQAATELVAADPDQDALFVRDYLARADTEPREWFDAAVFHRNRLVLTADELTTLIEQIDELITPFATRTRPDPPGRGPSGVAAPRAIPITDATGDEGLPENVKDILRSMSFTSAADRDPRSARRAGRRRPRVAARAVSTCGDFLAATALALTLQSRGAGGHAVAALLLAAAVPPVLLARWTGRLADRVDSRLLLVATGLAQAAICAVLPFTTVPRRSWSGWSPSLSCGYAVTQPTLGALLPAMVRREDLVRAPRCWQTANSIGMLVAPALAGLLIGAFGLRVPLFVDAASYLAGRRRGLIRTRRGGPTGTGDRRTRQSPDRWTVRPGGCAPTRCCSRWSWWPPVVAAITAVNVADVFLVRAVLALDPDDVRPLTAVWTGRTMIGGWLFSRRAEPMNVGHTSALVLVCVAVLGLAVASRSPAVAGDPLFLSAAPATAAQRRGRRAAVRAAESRRRRAVGPCRASSARWPPGPTRSASGRRGRLLAVIDAPGCWSPDRPRYWGCAWPLARSWCRRCGRPTVARPCAAAGRRSVLVVNARAWPWSRGGPGSGTSSS